MKFLHTSDLHIGKNINEISLLEDQRHFLNEIADIAAAEGVDAIVAAGDIYDRSIPSTEAVELLDEFLCRLAVLKIPLIMISGNHDSPERLGFAEKILEKQGVYIGGMVEEPLKKVIFEDDYGTVEFHLLPFVKPAVVGARTSGEAVGRLLKVAEPAMDKENRHVLVTHFFVTAGGKPPELSDSETSIFVGGIDDVEAGLFKSFDYVALGHIHKQQRVGEAFVYYCGTPMKYSFSEVNQTKGVQLVTLLEKGKVIVEQRVLVPLHDMRKIKGRLLDLINPQVVKEADSQDYIQVTLTDEEEIIDPIGTLRSVYPNVCQLILARREGHGGELEAVDMGRSKTVLELYEEFYALLTGHEMDEPRREAVTTAIRQAEGEET